MKIHFLVSNNHLWTGRYRINRYSQQKHWFHSQQKKNHHFYSTLGTHYCFCLNGLWVFVFSQACFFVCDCLFHMFFYIIFPVFSCDQNSSFSYDFEFVWPCVTDAFPCLLSVCVLCEFLLWYYIVCLCWLCVSLSVNPFFTDGKYCLFTVCVSICIACPNRPVWSF